MCLSAFIGTVSAQDVAEDRPMRNDSMPVRERRMVQTPNPEKAAKAETDRLQEALQLTDKQYKKVYKLNLEAEKERLENRPPMRPGRGGERGEGREGRQRPQRNNARPSMPPTNDFGWGNDEQSDDMFPSMPQTSREDRAETLRKNAEKREKKMKKILTDEQFDKWKQLQEQKQPRRHRPDAPVPPEAKEKEGEA